MAIRILELYVQHADVATANVDIPFVGTVMRVSKRLIVKDSVVSMIGANVIEGSNAFGCMGFMIVGLHVRIVKPIRYPENLLSNTENVLSVHADFQK